MRRCPPALLTCCVLLSACWADFPDSRFNVDQSTSPDLTVTVDTARDAPVVVPDSAPGDAQVPLETAPGDGPLLDAIADQDTCPAECTGGCQGTTCVMSCPSSCTCPAGWDCDISCGSTGCQGKVDCSKANKCKVACGAGQSCGGEILCGSGQCTVDCPPNSCQGNIACGPGKCEVSCGPGACTGTVDCALSCGCSLSCSGPSSCTNVLCPPACNNKCEKKDGCDNC